MAFLCRRCDRFTEQGVYRVTTEDDGVPLLNILVCSACARIARSLGLTTVKLRTKQTDLYLVESKQATAH
jgi:hypothetical protein